MSKVIFDRDNIAIMDLVSKISHVNVKDCFKEEDVYYCIVNQGNIGKAIGKGGINIKKINQIANKKIRFIEFNNDPTKFVRNFIYPIKVEEVVQTEQGLEIRDSNKKTKGLLIGRDEKHLKLLNRAIQRFFDVEVKII